jgi:hypothetical protein
LSGWAAGRSGPTHVRFTAYLDPVRRILFAVGVAITSSLIMGIAVSMVAGLAIGAAGGVGVGLGLELGVGLIRARGTALDVVVSAAIFGAAFGLFFSMSGNPIKEMARVERVYTPARQLLDASYYRSSPEQQPPIYQRVG